MDNDTRKEIIKFYTGCAILSLHKFFSRLISTCAIVGATVGTVYGSYLLVINPTVLLWFLGIGVGLAVFVFWLDLVEWARRETGFGKYY